MAPHEEESLIRRAQNGDREALGTLWDFLTPKLFGYLVNVTCNRTLAEDLLQATWLSAIEALPRFQPRGIRVSAWFFAIARNECRQHWRKSKREIPFDPLKHDAAEDKSGKVEDKVLIDQILAALAKDDRELLRLRYIADLHVKDIARILNINFVTARVRLHRALARARVALVSHKT